MSTATAEASTEAAPPREKTPYERIGGHEAFQAITDRFYDLMDTDPAYAKLRQMHAPDLAPMRASLAGFLTGWAGGPRDWWQKNPGKCMMSMHSPFVIDKEVAGQWADAMKRAIADVAPADTEIAGALSDVLEKMALGMAKG